MKRLLLLLLGINFFTAIFSQEHLNCGTDEMHQQVFQNRPDLNPGIIRSNERLKSDTDRFLRSPKEKSGDPYIIPVVFHIIHNGGPENISDAQIHDAIQQVNLQLRKLNPDTNEIVTPFKSIAADCHIEIRLAQLDPQGNCTSGITRTVSPLTLIGDHQVKSLIHWPPDKYLNVYICNQAAGLAGHALLPSAADTIPEWDGIVMQHSYVGTIGTSEYFRRTVLTHEIGHYLNLQHIWGGNNVPDYYYLPVAQAGNCAFDDEVDDTPLTIGWQNCNLSGNSCSTLDNVQNYMDYSYCARMFTEGQRDRMHACLNSSVADRNNLWSPQNLAATGTDGLVNYLCGASFEASKRVACVGETITLWDVSYHGVDSRQWNIPGATISSVSDSIITISFSAPGEYGAGITVDQGTEQMASFEEAYFRIFPTIGTEQGLYESFEDELIFKDQFAVVPTNGILNWEIDEQIGYKSDQSLVFRNFTNGTSSVVEFVSEPLNVQGLGALHLTFDLAYAKRTGAGNELLQIAVSTDCGNTWNVRKSMYASSNLATVTDIFDTEFIPSDTSQWRNEALTNLTATYLTDDLMFKFRYEAKGGNNIFIDNIRIAHPDVIGLGEQELNSVQVYPNPFNEIIEIDLGTFIFSDSIELYDLSGKLIQLFLTDEDSNRLTLDTSDLNQGVYLMRVQTNVGENVFKVVK
jgi:hypothetical protein